MVFRGMYDIYSLPVSHKAVCGGSRGPSVQYCNNFQFFGCVQSHPVGVSCPFLLGFHQILNLSHITHHISHRFTLKTERWPRHKHLSVFILEQYAIVDTMVFSGYEQRTRACVGSTMGFRGTQEGCIGNIV